MHAFDFLRRSVYDCITAGKFPSSDPETISQTLWSGVHGITALLITFDKGFPWVNQKQLIPFVVDTLILGVATRHA